MQGLSKYIPLKTIVSYTLDECNKSDGDFDKAWIFGLRGYADMGMDILWEPVSVRLPLSPTGNKTIQLPGDYICWTKIGILNNNGEVSTLRINNSLSIFKDTNPNRLNLLTPDVRDSINLIFTIPFFLNYFDNGTYLNLFGIGGGLVQHGGCKVDEKNNIIILEEHFRFDHVILEYIAAPQFNGDLYVEMAAQESIIAFIKWKFRLGTDKDYYAECIKARRRLPNKRFTLQTFNEVIRLSSGQYLRS